MENEKYYPSQNRLYCYDLYIINFTKYNIFTDKNSLLINRSLEIYSRYVKYNFKNTNYLLSIIGLLTF